MSGADSDLARDFGAANDRALEGNHEAAIALYRSLLDRGATSADVFFNLGNTYAEAGRRVDAIVAWEEALRRAPGDPDIISNLDTVRAELAPKTALEEEAPIALADVVEPLIAPFAPDALAAVWLGCSFGFWLLLFGLGRRWGQRRRRLWIGLTVLLAALALGASLALGGRALVESDPRAVIVDSTDLKEGPNPKFKAKGKAWAGARARVLGRDGAWLWVRLTDGQSGWIQAERAHRL